MKAPFDATVAMAIAIETIDSLQLFTKVLKQEQIDFEVKMGSDGTVFFAFDPSQSDQAESLARWLFEKTADDPRSRFLELDGVDGIKEH